MRVGLAVFIALLLVSHSWGQALLVRPQEPDAEHGGLFPRTELSPHLSLLVDPTGKMDIHDVMAEGTRFEANQRKTPSFGFTRSVVWVRFTVRAERNLSEDLTVELGTARLNHVTWHVVADGNLVQTLSCGAADVPRRQERRPSLDLDLPSGTERTIYLRAESNTAIWLPLWIGSSGVMQQAALRQATGDALQTGFCLAIVFLSLLLAWLRRAQLYLYLALIAAGYSLYYVIFNGYLTQMWPQAPLWIERQGLGLTVGLALYAFPMLNRSFHLGLPETGRLQRAFEGLARGLPLVIVASFLLFDFRVAIRWMEVMAVAGVLCGLVEVLGRGRPRREDLWFAAAWGGLGLTLVVLGLQFGNLTPMIVPIRALQLLMVPSILTAFFLAVLMKQRASEAEEQRHMAERQAYEVMSSIAAGTYEVILKTDNHGGVTPQFRFASPQFLDIFDLTREALLADPAAIASRIHPDDRPLTASAIAEIFANNEVFRWEGRVVVRGETKWFLIASTSRTDHVSDTIWSGLVTDVTARVVAERMLADTLENEKRLRAEAEELRLQAEQAHKAKSLFLAKMSHEIRTPLSALVSLSQAMWMRGQQQEADTDFTRLLNRVRSGGQYLNLLLRNVLNVSAAESGRVPLTMSEFYVVDWIEEISNILEPISEYHRSKIEWKLPGDDEARWRTDQMRLTQIALNLGENALKFSAGRDEPVTIAVDISGGRLRLVVEDHGPGIPQTQMATVFAEYAQVGTEVSPVDKGVGLGLAVVKINAELLGGSVRVQAMENRGTRFVVELPEMEKHPKEHPEAVANSAASEKEHFQS